jgi:predicted amidohydrolase YtcJ
MTSPTPAQPPALLLHNARITTMDPARPEATALLAVGDRIIAVGGDELLAQAPAGALRLDAGGRRVVPGLNDSHIHGVRQGLNHAMELRWDAQTSLSDALARLREQAARTPPGQWVRVVGGWSAAQFSERRHPTIADLNAATGDVPCYVLHLYDYALINRAGLRALGITRDTPDTYPRGRIVRDTEGNPTGLMLAAPNAVILYSLLNQLPKLDPDTQRLSTRHFFRELNRYGVTGFLDAGGGFLNYPDDYGVLTEVHRRGEMTVRVGFSLFAQKAGGELEDFRRWTDTVAPDQGDDFLKINGAGEMLRASAYDFEDFILPRPELPPHMEDDLLPVVELLARKRWPFRFHATYDQSATRLLNVLEIVNRAYPLAGLHWIFDHGETLGEANLERIARLGGGVSVQNRIAFQEKQFLDRYGAAAANDAPPLKKILAMGIPLANGTDATRVSSYNPWLSIHWTVSGRGMGGSVLIGEANRLDRHTALRLYTDNGWFSREADKKGRLAPGLLADFAILSADYFSVPEDEIRDLESLLTVVGGRVVHASAPFAAHAPAPLADLPEWSPLRHYGGYRP